MNTYSYNEGSAVRFAATVDMTSAAVTQFLSRLQLSYAPYVRDPELEERVNSVIASWGHCRKQVSPEHISTAVAGTIAAYSHVSNFETKVQIAVFTSVILAMDDPLVFNGLSSKYLLQQLCTGTIQGQHGLLHQLTEILAEMWDHYSIFSANAIVASTFRFVNASLLENECGCKSSPLRSDHLPFVEYKRSMSATTEAYACLIWEKSRFPDVEEYMHAIPDVMLYVSYVNDILSFYKEELAGETDNYVHERARAAGKLPVDTLGDIIEDTIAAVGRARTALGEGAAREAFENFAAGYAAVHISNPRYRLREILKSDQCRL